MFFFFSVLILTENNIFYVYIRVVSSLGGSVVKNPPAMQETQEAWVWSLGLGRCPGVGNGNPLQYSCLKNPMDRAAWQATVHGVTESQTRLSIHTLLALLEMSEALWGRNRFNSKNQICNIYYFLLDAFKNI